MKKSKFNHNQIASILKEFDTGKSVEDISREHGVSKATFYKWRQRYGGMDAEANLNGSKSWKRRMLRLKRMYANLAMELDVINTLLKKALSLA
ncbi:MAG: transposase [Chitinophagaceae bacterium]